MLSPQPFENQLRCMPLLRRRRHVGRQDRIDHRNQRPEFWPFRSLGPHIAGRRRISAHLGYRIPAQSKHPRRFPPALPFNENKLPDRCVNLHDKHPWPPLRISIRKGSTQKWTGFTPPRDRTKPPLPGRLLRRRVHCIAIFVRRGSFCTPHDCSGSQNRSNEHCLRRPMSRKPSVGFPARKARSKRDENPIVALWPRLSRAANLPWRRRSRCSDSNPARRWRRWSAFSWKCRSCCPSSKSSAARVDGTRARKPRSG